MNRLHAMVTAALTGSTGSSPRPVEISPLAHFFRVLMFSDHHQTSLVLLGTTMLGIAAGTIGTFAVLRHRALIGDAMAHATLPGVALAFIVASAANIQGRSTPILMLGAAITGILGVLAVNALLKAPRIREDAAIAVVLSTFFGLGVVLLSYIQTMPRANAGGLAHYIYGQTASMLASDARVIAIAAAAVTLLVVLFFKEFRIVCFDDRYAAGLGLPVSAIDLLTMALMVLVTVIGLQAVGLLLIVAMLIIPPAAARFWTDRLGLTTILAGVFGGISAAIGTALSAVFLDLPTGGVIVLAAGGLFTVSTLAAPRRGIVAAGIRHSLLRWRVVRDHTLRTLFEAAETQQPRSHTDSVVRRRLLAQWLQRRGLAARVPAAPVGTLALTPKGVREAAAVVRRHRLWEQYLLTHADRSFTHVDRSADMVEHVLSPEAVDRLEAALQHHDPGVPPSPHPLHTPDTDNDGSTTPPASNTRTAGTVQQPPPNIANRSDKP